MANKAIFLDRDDTLVDDPGYINSPDQLKLLPGVGYALTQMRKMGYKLFIITNQSGIARGMITENQLEQIHQRLKALLQAEGVFVDAIYYSPYHPDGVVPEYTKVSTCRKPEPGMLLKAADQWDIDLENSWMIGNGYSDITAGHKAGCRTILIDSSAKPVGKKPHEAPEPDRIVSGIREAANVIKMFDAQNRGHGPLSNDTNDTPPAIKTVNHSLDTETSDKTAPETESEQNVKTPNEDMAGVSRTAKFPKTHTAKATVGKQLSPSGAADILPDNQDTTEKLLGDILQTLKTQNRNRQYHEDFSLSKAAAGASQIFAVFFVVLSFCFWLNPHKVDSSTLIVLGYAIMFQLCAIALYIMRGRES